MIIFIYIIFINACSVRYDTYNLYPTEGERLEIAMDKLIQGSNLSYICYKCTEEGISVQNIFKNHYHFKYNYTFKSVSFNDNNIFALTTEPSLNIYLKIKGKMQARPIRTISINNNLECFSITYTEFYNIVLDCYQDQTLFLYSLQGSKLIQIYTSNSSTPNKTKISSIINDTLTYIIYGQSFTYTNLTDLNQTILNLTILHENKLNSFIATDNLSVQAYNFFVSKRETTNQTIFIQFSKNIKSYVLSQFKTLVEVKNMQFNYDIINMAYYYFKDQYYQFDRLFLIVLDDDYDYMYFVDVFYCDQFNVQILTSNQKPKTVDKLAQIFISKQFIIIYNNKTISIMNNERFNQILFYQQYVLYNNTVIYLDELSEELFIFSNITRIYQLQVPILSFASNQSKGNFVIQAQEIYENFKIYFCKVKINYSQVNQLDNNIYFIFQYQQQSYYNLLQLPFVYWINGLSGPLVNTTAYVSNPKLGSFQDNTLRKVNQSLSSKQQYYMVKAFSVNLFQECETKSFSCIFVVAVNDQNMDLYKEGTKLPFNSINIADMKFNVTQIEITFVVHNRQLCFIVCLSFGQNIIQLYEFNNQLQRINQTTLNTTTFKQFQLLSNSVVLLLYTNQILITPFNNNKSQMLFNSDILEEIASQKIDLNLKNIFINQQYQSRVIYINNQNSFIIGYITEQFKFELRSIQNVIFQIENIQVVNNLLIMCWYPQQEKIIHFDVWNVNNSTNPINKGKMRSINFVQDKNDVSYYSDNQFLYVQISSYLNVYNPNLPQHSSLYYRIPFDGLYFTSIAIDQIVFLCFNYNFYLLSPILLQTFQNSTIHKNFFIEQIFNFTFSSYLNGSKPIYLPNNSVTIINDYLYIDLKETNIKVNKSQSHVVLYKNNISFSGQALQFNIINKQDNWNISNLTNNIEYFNNKNYTNNQKQKIYYNQIIQYNKSQFLLMNNQNILNYNSNTNYRFDNYNNCISSIAQDQIIYALCQNINSQYQIISINLSNITNNNYLLYPNQIVNLTNQTYTQNAWIRIQNNQLYIWNDTIRMYFINQIQQPKDQFICKSTQFGFQTIQIYEGDNSTIIYFYFKPYNKDQLYYKFAQLINNQTISLGNEHFILLESITQQFFSFDTIPMIVRKNKEIILMISNSNFNLIVSFLLIINKSNIITSQIIFQSIIQTSPPFEKHNFTVSQLPQYDSGLLLCMYSNTSNTQNQTHMITFYNISFSKNISFSTPLLFEGGYNFTLNTTLVNAFSLIAQNNSNGNILVLFNNGSTLELQLNIFSIKINLTQSKDNNDLNLTAYNYYNSGQALIKLKIEQEHLFDRTSFFILFGVTMIVLVTSVLIYSIYQKGNYDEEENQEDEL